MKLLTLVTAAALAALPGIAFAQGWPTKPIKLVVPFPPGGGTDAMARLVGSKLTSQAGWTIVVDNKPGGGGNLGLDLVAKAPPDGYTIGLGQAANLAINPALYSKMPFDSLKDFAPISSVASQPVVLLVNATSPLKSLKDVVAASKAKPESLRIGLAGNGTVGHLAGEMLQRRADFKMLNVPYKGAAPAMTDLMGDHVDLNFASPPPTIPQVANQKVRALAVSSAERMKTVPELAEVPTVAESGYPGFEAINWTGLVAPAGTPSAIIDRLNAEVQKVLADPEIQVKLAAEGSTPMGGTPKQFADYIQAEHQKWGALIREANIKLD